MVSLVGTEGLRGSGCKLAGPVVKKGRPANRFSVREWGWWGGGVGGPGWKLGIITAIIGNMNGEEWNGKISKCGSSATLNIPFDSVLKKWPPLQSISQNCQKFSNLLDTFVQGKS